MSVQNCQHDIVTRVKQDNGISFVFTSYIGSFLKFYNDSGLFFQNENFCGNSPLLFKEKEKFSLLITVVNARKNFNFELFYLVTCLSQTPFSR